MYFSAKHENLIFFTHLTNCSHYQDDTPAIVVASFPVSYEGFGPGDAAGPVPVFFSEDTEATLQVLKSSPEFALSCLQALVSRLLALEAITRLVFQHNFVQLFFCLNSVLYRKYTNIYVYNYILLQFWFVT